MGLLDGAVNASGLFGLLRDARDTVKIDREEAKRRLSSGSFGEKASAAGLLAADAVIGGFVDDYDNPAERFATGWNDFAKRIYNDPIGLAGDMATGFEDTMNLAATQNPSRQDFADMKGAQEFLDGGGTYEQAMRQFERDRGLAALELASMAMGVGGVAGGIPKGAIGANAVRRGSSPADLTDAQIAQNSIRGNVKKGLTEDQKAQRKIDSAAKSAATREAVARQQAGEQSGISFDEYLNKVNPDNKYIPEENRPNLQMGDMYGMLPKDAELVSEFGEASIYRGGDGNFFATAHNKDLGEQDVVGYISKGNNETDLMVVDQMQGKGIGSELQRYYRSENPYAPTGGLTEAGKASLEKTYKRLLDDGIISANNSALAGLLGPLAQQQNEDIIKKRMGLLAR